MRWLFAVFPQITKAASWAPIRSFSLARQLARKAPSDALVPTGKTPSLGFHWFEKGNTDDNHRDNEITDPLIHHAVQRTD